MRMPKAMNPSTASAIVVILAFNESTVVAEVVAQVQCVCPNVVLVDDGSSDETGDIARRAGAIVVRHAINLGQGAALHAD